MPDPTPEEIQAMCAAIRKGWKPAKERQRAGRIEKPWTVPIVRVSLSRSLPREEETVCPQYQLEYI